jgi:hypothetical protein
MPPRHCISSSSGALLGAGTVVDEQGLELFAFHITLDLSITCKVFGRMLGDVGIDVLGRLLTADG